MPSVIDKYATEKKFLAEEENNSKVINVTCLSSTTRVAGLSWFPIADRRSRPLLYMQSEAPINHAPSSVLSHFLFGPLAEKEVIR